MPGKSIQSQDLYGLQMTPELLSGLPTSATYELTFATTPLDVTSVRRLRYNVFNEELNEGLDQSRLTGLDADEYDFQCHHLLVRHKQTCDVVGTYRMQTVETAASNRGFYSATVFDLSKAPVEFIRNSVEIGRACIRQDHRSLQVLYLLWKGIGHFCMIHGKKYLFGCCSLTGQDVDHAFAVERYLMERGHIHPDLNIPALESHRCDGFGANLSSQGHPPRLMRTYLSLGAKICSPPAIDRAFKTIDFLTVFDLTAFDALDSAFYHLKP